MRKVVALCALSLLIVVTATLGGCAAYHAEKKCRADGCPGDPSITAEVQELLKQHRELQPPNLVYVKTVDGVVYLSGQVATDLQRDTAVAAARGAPGARQVVDTIALTYSGR